MNQLTKRLLTALSIKYGETISEVIDRLVWDEFIDPPKVYEVIDKETNKVLFFGRYLRANDFAKNLRNDLPDGGLGVITFVKQGRRYW